MEHRSRISAKGPGLRWYSSGGALDDGSENAALVPALASKFTVYNYARRGRAASGDTQPYAVQRELEDLAALDVAGGSAHVFGASTGAALALEAAAAELPVDRLVVYDVPYSVGAEAVARWRKYRASLAKSLTQGQIDEALAAFMRLGGALSRAFAAASLSASSLRVGHGRAHLTPRNKRHTSPRFTSPQLDRDVPRTSGYGTLQ